MVIAGWPVVHFENDLPHVVLLRKLLCRKALDTMNSEDRTAKELSATEGRSLAKKPYQKPEFRSERVFETTALACGKVSPSEANCRNTILKSS